MFTAYQYDVVLAFWCDSDKKLTKIDLRFDTENSIKITDFQTSVLFDFLDKVKEMANELRVDISEFMLHLETVLDYLTNFE